MRQLIIIIGAAASLKYARAEDLPSYPSQGGVKISSAGAAANLANDNHKDFEYWKANSSSDAGKAAMLAKDYKMQPLWKPEGSAAGSKAAFLAARDGGKLNLWHPEPTAEGNSAAHLAMGKNLSPQLDYGYTADGKKRALMAATGALGRSRSGSTPTPALPAYPDSKNSAHNALNAATVANRTPSKRATKNEEYHIDSAAMEAARIKHLAPGAVDKEMWGSKPPVELEMEEKRHQAALRASAVSMAKQMMEYQRRHDEEVDQAGVTAAAHVHGRTYSTASTQPDLKSQALQYIHLQEAAQKLAAERLAKLDPDANTRYRSYYGYEDQQPRHRYSIRGRGRRRAESVTEDPDSDDEFQARRVRNQMSQFNNNIAEIDAKKRQNDRAALLAAAERKVHAQMHNMDEQVYAETGKVSPAMMEEWEAKARARAAKESEARMKNHGRVDLGNGRFMDQSEIEAIAAARLKPTLTEINDTAEKRRAKDEEIRLEREEFQRQQRSEKERERDTKAEQKRLRRELHCPRAKLGSSILTPVIDEEKAAAKAKKQEQKAAARIEKDAEKARRAEEKRLAKERKHQSKDLQKESEEAAAASARKSIEEPATTTEPASTTTTTTTAAVVTPAIVTESVDGPRESVEHTDEDRPARLERHVSTVLSSSSSSSASSSRSSVSSLEPATTTETMPNMPNETARQIAERVLTADVDAEGRAPETEVVATTTTEDVKPSVGVEAPSTTAEKERDLHDEPKTPSTPSKSAGGGGFGRFFKGLRRKSRADYEPGRISAAKTSVSTSTEDPKTSVDSAALTGSGAGAAGAGGVVEDAELGSGSPSSFRRHDSTSLHSVSTMSSSTDAEAGEMEMEQRRGRGGRLGLFGAKDSANVNANPKATPKAKGSGGVTRDDDESGEDEFEEARDTFDESLAPPPSFAGQPKSGSPVRETKFQEVL